MLNLKEEGLNTTLWVADPHINEGVNRRVDSEKSPIGLYKVTLNDAGSQIDCSLDKQQISHMYSAGSYTGLHFDSKRWMVLFPLNKVC